MTSKSVERFKQGARMCQTDRQQTDRPRYVVMCRNRRIVCAARAKEKLLIVRLSNVHTDGGSDEALLASRWHASPGWYLVRLA